jgi:hypothetical protein
MNIKLLEKALDKESFYVLGVILLNIANLLIFSKNDLMILINSILILGIYFYISKRKDKKLLFVTLIHFSIYGVLFESLIIKKTNLLKYNNPTSLNIPIWLLPIYCSFALGAIQTYNFFKILI